MAGNFVTLNPQLCVADELRAGDIARVPGRDMVVVNAITHCTAHVDVVVRYLAGNRFGMEDRYNLKSDHQVTRFLHSQ